LIIGPLFHPIIISTVWPVAFKLAWLFATSFLFIAVPTLFTQIRWLSLALLSFLPFS